MYMCNKCGKEYKNRWAFLGHCSTHVEKKPRKDSVKKENQNLDHKCKHCGKTFLSGVSLGGHIVSCKQNPKRNEWLKKTKVGIKNSTKNKIVTNETRKKISNSMKQLHKEGKAWNIGKSRWNNKQSYPEKFFQKVIENEFEDKDFLYEHNVDIYSIDFAWPKKKLAIEIDGEQHYRFEDYIERDKRKDKKLNELGWNVLRIRWKELYNDTKYWIKIAKDFVHQ